MLPPGFTNSLLPLTYEVLGTAISLIRGDIKSSNSGGEILINGLSMDNNRNLARSQLGVCPQFDACDTLTVKQQLLFYARVRGVANPSQNTEELIRAFGLETFRDRLAQKVSKSLSIAYHFPSHSKARDIF